MSPSGAKPANRGEIWFAQLDPTIGHEQAGRRPVLIVSSDGLNHGRAGLVVICPLTRTPPRVPAHLGVPAEETGLAANSTILCDQIRTLSVTRLADTAAGRVSPATMATLEGCLRLLLAL